MQKGLFTALTSLRTFLRNYRRAIEFHKKDLEETLAIAREIGNRLDEVQESISPSDALEERFQTLAKTWRDECSHLSSVQEMILHPAYQQIVGMGPAALPLILKELELRHDHWFWALRAITQEDPVSPGHRGNVDQMAMDWLLWARRREIRWPSWSKSFPS